MALFFFEDISVIIRGPFFPRTTQSLVENLNALCFLSIMGAFIAAILNKPLFSSLMFSLCTIAAMYYKTEHESKKQFTPVTLQKSTQNSYLKSRVNHATYSLNKMSHVIIPLRK